MSKKHYFFGIFFLGATIVAGLWNSIIRFQLGPRMYNLGTFLDWALVTNVIALVGSLFVLKYYHYKKYQFTLVSGIIAAIANFYAFVIFYTMSGSVQFMNYYLPALLIMLGTSIVYGLSLVFSIAGQRICLRFAGIFTFLISAVLFGSIIWFMSSPDLQASAILEKISQWASLVANIVPALYILNFMSELDVIDDTSHSTPMPKNLEHGSVAIGAIATMFLLVYGVMITGESSVLKAEGASNQHWENRNYELAVKLSQQFEAREFIGSNGDTLLYRLLKPLDHDPEEKYPLVVCLHHGGLHGNDNIKQLSSQPVPLLAGDDNRSKYPAFLFAPQSPEGASFGRMPYYPSIDSLVFEAIIELEREFEIDEKRRYVAGISGGGYGSWNLISAHPEMFAAAIPICGGGDPKYGSDLTKVAIWAFHGKNDKSVPVQLSRDMINAIKAAGGNPRYTEYPDKGHGIWQEVKATPGLLEWLFSQRKDT